MLDIKITIQKILLIYLETVYSWEFFGIFKTKIPDLQYCD